ncbi:small multidrug resistance pump [Flavobacterium sp. 90]|uniref:DMT family transporter n=1 Tax=unclassified Flavobacterium TaxID=196869 RepID=UPI000EAD3309|nr:MULTISPECIES: SMR family transporter [unclassified Flavobacterium]RKR09580.1 small multidrug resistance pump [Flavobacterium sp. 81]TCK53363.1 small multidrug resistance pump [Flavobacterium sp. 90]
MKNFFFLGIAIIFEIIATSALKKSEQFTQLIPSIVTIVGYFAAFYFLSFAIRTIPVGIAYAIWSGVGIVLITIIGAVFFKQIPDLPAIIGLALIMIGVVVINLFSKTTAH